MKKYQVKESVFVLIWKLTFGPTKQYLSHESFWAWLKQSSFFFFGNNPFSYFNLYILMKNFKLLNFKLFFLLAFFLNLIIWLTENSNLLLLSIASKLKKQNKENHYDLRMIFHSVNGFHLQQIKMKDDDFLEHLKD